MAVLAQRVIAHEALGASDRVRPVGLLLVVAQEPHERVGEAQAEAFTLVDDPLVVTVGDELAAVRVHGCLKAPIGQRLLEVGEIEVVRAVVAPPQRPGRRLEEPVGLRQPVAHRVQEVTQVRARLRLGGVRPEAERQALSGLRHTAVNQQVTEQRNGTG